MNPQKISDFYSRLASIHRLRTIEHLLDWDQQVCLPEQGGEFRASQLTHMASLLHKEQTDPAFIDLIEDLFSQIDLLNPEDAVNVRETRHKIERERKIPARLVEEKARLCSETYRKWVDARPAGDFKAVAPLFKQLVAVVREEASCNKVSDDLYDGLFDYYEPGGRIAVIGPLLLKCAEKISSMLPSIIEKQGKTPTLQGTFTKEKQEALTRTISAAIGYSYSSGRLDTAPHPFQTTLGPNDFRITTRWDESTPFPSLYGVIHEIGHALYEMGLQKRWVGTPMGSYISLGIHESQSRFWENIVGRSAPFCRYMKPVLDNHFSSLSSFTPDHIWKIVNEVTPSFIRVEADEVTYTLHIVIRMELEKQLVSGSISVADLPDAWNQMYKKFLGLTPPDNRDGVLQDIHWFSGSIGYFPTYALGNLYGAMFTEEIRKTFPDFDSRIEKGDFAPILGWLNTNIHAHGMMYRGPGLIQKITGKELTAEPFVKYIESKYLG